ncbi:hypothetical protein QQP08_021899 [Theobroma cacao]|nr:hypothetical protein QQP08_021899 [Theobroma cacao]
MSSLFSLTFLIALKFSVYLVGNTPVKLLLERFPNDLGIILEKFHALRSNDSKEIKLPIELSEPAHRGAPDKDKYFKDRRLLMGLGSEQVLPKYVHQVFETHSERDQVKPTLTSGRFGVEFVLQRLTP